MPQDIDHPLPELAELGPHHPCIEIRSAIIARSSQVGSGTLSSRRSTWSARPRTASRSRGLSSRKMKCVNQAWALGWARRNLHHRR